MWNSYLDNNHWLDFNLFADYDANYTIFGGMIHIIIYSFYKGYSHVTKTTTSTFI